jgi:hypothetical protein
MNNSGLVRCATDPAARRKDGMTLVNRSFKAPLAFDRRHVTRDGGL